MTHRPKGAKETIRHRYPGPPPFEDTPEDRFIFFGRDAEKTALSQLVIASRLVVLFSKSGLGKTSLLNAGVFPLLREQALFPVRIRVSSGVDAATLVTSAVRSAAKAYASDCLLGPAETLWETFKKAAIWRAETLLTPVLIFDQFEEVFTVLKAEERAALATEIGSLVSGTMPERVRKGQRALPERDRFSDAPPEVKVILTLREEYLGALEELSFSLPLLFQNRFRLLPLADEHAARAIRLPAELVAEPGDPPFACEPFQYSDDAITAMLNFLRGRSRQIEPWELQILCRHVEQHVVPGLRAQRGAGAPICVAPQDLGGNDAMDRILHRFFEDELSQLPRGQQSKARELCDTGLVSDQGRRLSLERDQILGEWGITAATLEQLETSRLLRREPRLESTFYEISHDTLAESISARRVFRIPRRWRTATWVFGAMLLLAVGVTIAGYQGIRAQRDQAEHERDKATQSRGQSESLATFLLSDDVQEKLRRSGQMRTMARDMLDQVDHYLAKTASEDQTRGTLVIAGFNAIERGDIARVAGPLDDAARAFHEAWEYFRRAETTEAPGKSAHGSFDGEGGALGAANALVPVGSASVSAGPLPARANADIDVKRGLAQTLENLADVEALKGHLRKAIEQETTAVGIRKEIRDQTKSASARRKFAEASVNLASFLRQHGKLRDAAKHVAVAIAEIGDSARDAAEPRWSIVLTTAEFVRGEIAAQQHDYDAAERAYELAAREAEWLISTTPLDLKAQADYALALFRLAQLNPKLGSERAVTGPKSVGLLLTGEPPSATVSPPRVAIVGDAVMLQAVYERLVKTMDAMVASETQNQNMLRERAAARMWFGYALARQRRTAEARQRYDASLADFAALSRKDPTNTLWQEDVSWVHEWLGDIAQGERKREHYHEALERAAKLSKGDPDNRDLSYRQVRLEFELVRELRGAKEFDGALDALKRIQDILDAIDPVDPTDAAYAELRGKVELERARCRHKGANSGLPEAIELAEAALREEPGSAVLLSEYATEVRRLGDKQRQDNDLRAALRSYGIAERCLRRAIEKDANSSRRVHWNQLCLLFYDGVAPARSAAKDMNGVVAAYRASSEAVTKAVQLAPDDDVLRSNLALAQRQMGDALRRRLPANFDGAYEAYQRAEEQFKKAIDLNPAAKHFDNLFSLRYELAALEKERHQPTAALTAMASAAEAANRAAEKKPTDAIYQYNVYLAHSDMAEMLKLADKIDVARISAARWRALVAADRAAKLEPRSAPYSMHKARAALKLATFLNQLEDAEAIAHLDPAMQSVDLIMVDAIQASHRNIELAPTDPVAWNLAGLVACEQARFLNKSHAGPAALTMYRQCAEDMRKAISLNPNEPTYGANLQAILKEARDANLGEL